jgi:ketosteroid isomerase-like protein
MNTTRTPAQVLDRLVTATNAHDIDTMVDCFAPDYALTDPVHPARSFTGSAQVRRNWTTMFDAVPDVRLDVQDVAVTDTGFWLEAAQVGTRRDGRRLEMRTVFITAVSHGQIRSARMYAAPVEQGGPGIDAVFAAMAGAVPSSGDAAEGTDAGGHRASRP